MVLCTGDRENTANVWTRLLSSKTGRHTFLHGKYADTRFPRRDLMHGLFPFALPNKDSTSHLGAPLLVCTTTTVLHYNCAPTTVPHYNITVRRALLLCPTTTMPQYELCPTALWTVPHYYCAPL